MLKWVALSGLWVAQAGLWLRFALNFEMKHGIIQFLTDEVLVLSDPFLFKYAVNRSILLTT